ncbi:uncharacterized protein LOC135817773 [Sycon ciliatum]|uniref:uncharacterized protein LOC135817773 n=1 Tax=Sycon ciliatum TaxID=27933 RepID=UPI0031F69FF4
MALWSFAYRTALLIALYGCVAASAASDSQLIFGFATDGSFSISIGEAKDVWIESGRSAVRINGTLMVLGKDLVSNVTFASSGQDVLGAYQMDTIKWKTKDTQQELFRTNFKTYRDLPAVVFEQHFPVSVDNPGGSSAELASFFPTFSATDKAITDLNYITYTDTFPSMHNGHFNNHSQFPGGTNGGVPLTIYDKSLRTLVISPLDNFMVGIQDIAKEVGGGITCGINGQVLNIPEGFNHSTIMWAGQGLKDTMYDWGGALLKYHGKSRTPLDSDFSVKYLGWWTDNGGYYHYNPETNKTYQQTMLDAKAKLEELNIPARYFQLDSWWYFQEASHGALTLWEPRPDVFPSGMSDWLGLPLSLHNRWFAAKNNYSADWFLVKEGQDCALPSSKELFDTIMSKTAKWGPGMFQYEQDWLVTTFERCAYSQTDIYASRNYLAYMAQGAADVNATVQYCMALPNHILQSTALQPVTLARASGDYSASSEQWAIGKTSLLYYSIGLIPFKDCFQTVTTNETGCQHKGRCLETNPTLQALVSTMSTGAIAPGDGIQFMNEDTVALLKRTCRWADGLILKPDAPAIIMDVVFQTVFSDTKMEPFELWHTYSDFSGVRFHYIIAAVLPNPFTLHTSFIQAPAGSNFIAYDYMLNCNMTATACAFTKWQTFNASSPLEIHVPKDEHLKTPTHSLPLHPFKYYVLAPVLANGWTFLGEGMKFSVASKQRFQSITGNAGQGLEVTLTGTSGEEISVSALTPTGEVLTASGTVGASLKATVECGSARDSAEAGQCKFTSE